MIKIFLLLGALIFSWAFVYLGFSYVNLDFNPFSWGREIRYMFLFWLSLPAVLIGTMAVVWSALE